MKIAIFSCHNSVWWWGLFLSYFGEAFKRHGYEIDFVTCGDAVDYSTAVGLNFTSSAIEKAKVRARSKRNTRWLTKGFGFNHVRLDALIKPDALKHPYDKDIEEKISVYASYETILTYKTYNNHTPEMLDTINAFHKGNSIIYFAAESYFRNSKPDLTFVWNGLYSFNRTWMLAAEKMNIPAYWIHAGANRGLEFRSIMYGSGDWFAYNAEQKKNWSQAEMNIELTAKDPGVIVAHLANTIFAKTRFTYSKPKQNLYYKKSRNIEKRKLIIMTTSSEDELLAARAVGVTSLENGSVFQKQTEWIEFVLDHFSKSKDYYLVLRVHPREFPNHREKKVSEGSLFYYSQYEKYKNSNSIHINLPQDNISLYDLLEEADLVLNAWSSVGEDAGLLGIPVISAFQNYCNYPNNLEPVYINKTEYLDVIKKEIKAGWSAQRALRFFKWRVFSTLRSEINLSHEYVEIRSSRLSLRDFLSAKRMIKWIKSDKDFLSARRMIKWIKSESFDHALQYFDIDNKHNELMTIDNYLEDQGSLKQYFQLVYDSLYKNSKSIIPNTLQNHIQNFIMKTQDENNA